VARKTIRPVAIERVVSRSSGRRRSGRHPLVGELQRRPATIHSGDATGGLGLVVVDDFDARIPIGPKELEAIETYLNPFLGLEKLDNPSQIEESKDVTIGTAPNACNDG
jgi:hypothetical protein